MKNPQICNVKRLILTVLLLALYWRGQAATHVVFDMEAFNASPATNRTVTMQRLQPFRGNLISYATGTNSSVTASNLGIGDYDCVILQRGAASAIPFQVTVTATNLGVIGANTNTSVRGQQSYPVSGTSSWTILASENRYGGGSIPDGSIATNKVDSEFWDFLLSLDGGGTPGDSGMLIPSAGRLTSASNELAATTGIFNAVQASTYSGSGAALTSLNASQLASGTVPEARSAHTVTNVLNYVDNTAVFLNKDTGANLLAFDSSAFLGTDEAWTTDIGIKSTAGFEGPAVGLTTGTPDLATNNGTATDGMVLSKQGNRLALISVGGGGDMIGANSLADIAGLGGSLALARTNLSAHNADNLTRGTVALVRLPSIPASQTTNSAKFSDWNMWTDGSTYYAQNKLLTSTLSSNNFSGLLQTVASSAVTAGFSTRITVASGTDASASVSNRYYWFTNTVILTNGIVLQGAGNAATIFAASPALTGPLIQVGADGNFLGGIARFENIRWHGDAGAASSVGLKFRNVAEPNVFNCEFNSFQLAGIQVNNTNYNHWSQILHCFFVGGGAGSHCVLIDAAPAAITCRLQIRDCDFEPHGGAAVTVSNHFRNLTITGSTFGDSSGTSTAGIRVYAGNGFQFIGNTFTPFWGSTVAPIRFDNRTSATNINADVSHNMANGLTTQSLIWIGTNVQGVSIVGNVNPGGNIVTNASLGNATYVRADREKIYTDGDITAGGTVSGAAASFPIQTNTVLNVGSLVIPNGWDASTATNIPVRALWGSGGTNTAATNGTTGQVFTSAGNGGGYWSAPGGGGGAALWFYKSMHPKAAWTATDGATRFWGEYDDSTSVQTNAVWRVPFACTATNLSVKVNVSGTLGSAENVAHQLLVNGSTVGLATTNAWNLAGPRWFTVAGSLSLAAGDVIALQVITPTFTTDPTGVRVDWTVNGTIP